MLSRYEIRARRCRPDLVRVVDQVDLKAAARHVMSCDMPLAALLFLWTILRDERTPLLRCVEDLGVDIWRLTCDVDELINQQNARAEAGRSGVWTRTLVWFRSAADPYARAWLSRAEREAQILGHRYLGVEHLLLAIAAEPDAPLAALLARHKLDHARLREAILAARPSETTVDVFEVLDVFKPFGARWDKPAVGVPRRYSLGMMLGMTAVYAVLFAVMRAAGAPPAVFLGVAVFFTGVVLGQPLLYGGRYPRAASIWIGAVLLPMEILLAIIYFSVSLNSVPPLAGVICWLLAFIPLGALFGYLAGCLAAGMFCVLDRLEQRKNRDATQPVEPVASDPFEKED